MIPCRNCGAELPEGAAFCPHCETALVEKRTAGRPHLWRRKTLGAGLALLAVFSLMAWAVAAGRNAPPSHEHQSYDGGAELLYESDGGAYHLLLAFDIVDWIPAVRAELAFSVAPRETGIRNYEEMPARLYAYREESRETCREEFLALVESCTVEAVPAEGARAMRCTQPEEDRSSPYVVLGSAIDYEPGDGSNDICWTLTMKNGDVIRMSQRLTIGETPVLTYRPEDTPLETAEELQALLDEIAETVTDRETEVRIFLPAVTYDEPILMRRACWLYGAAEGGSYRIRVVDNGRGIPPEELKRITEAFYMVDKSRSRKEHGAGLGLALSARIARLHHTALDYASKPGTGTMVTLTLQAVEYDGQEE